LDGAAIFDYCFLDSAWVLDDVSFISSSFDDAGSNDALVFYGYSINDAAFNDMLLLMMQLLIP
jgi:hypothetical protein